MKLVYKGILKSPDDLSRAVLPENAVKVKEPNTFGKFALGAYCIGAVVVLILLFISVLISLINGKKIDICIMFDAVCFAVLSIVPHELLHSIWLGKSAEAQIFIAPKQFMAFVYSTVPLSKRNYIWLSLFPTIVFGVVPFVVWAIMPSIGENDGIILGFALFSFFAGGGDFFNVINALRQMPKNSTVQMSQLSTYWYVPNKI